VTFLAIAAYPTEKIRRITVATRKAAGAPTPLPLPTTIGVFSNMAVIGAAPVTVRNNTPMRPTAFECNRSTSPRVVTSRLFAPCFPATAPELEFAISETPIIAARLTIA